LMQLWQQWVLQWLQHWNLCGNTLQDKAECKQAAPSCLPMMNAAGCWQHLGDAT